MHHRLSGLRFRAGIGFAISLALAVITVGPGLVAYQTAEPNPDCPAAKTRTNLVFIIDRSGSLADKIDPPHEGNPGRGQTYNVEIDGVRRALCDPSVIPRDGSVSVGAVLFDGEASIALPITSPVSSDTQAMDIAARIEALRCPRPEVALCPSGDTKFGTAIMQADQIASSIGGARRVFIMSTDGGATDGGKGVDASEAARQHASMAGVEAELDVILIGPPAAELAEVQEVVKNLVFPSPPGDLPGAVEVIAQTACNMPGAVFDPTCECQSRQFADFTRRALGSNVHPRNLKVTTALDPDPNTLLQAGGPLSLRQAIEMANSNGGHTVITFDPGVKTIEPNVPLPPLTAPDITICGCAADCSPSIPDKVTCPEPPLREEGGCARAVIIDGRGKLQDGILIRSNRDVVRGLTIKNFAHAGIVIQPVCPSDNTGFNRVELNELDDNVKAGVCVLDPPPGQSTAVAHNTGNTISMNDISGSETPIDLGSTQPFKPSEPMSVCDGPTANDAGDADEGPNTLLNFPAPFTANTTGKTVTITGSVMIPAVDCPVNDKVVVEVFAVTKIHPASGAAVVDAVTYFGRIILAATSDGTFSMTLTLMDRPLSPIDGYTATFTDQGGNTSELILLCSGPPKPKLSPQSITFGIVNRVDPGGAPSSSPQTQSFTIENGGCSALDLKLTSIARRGKDVGRLANSSEKRSGFFAVKQTSDSGAQIPIRIRKDHIAIAPASTQRFSVEFNPVIPRVIERDEEKSAGGLFTEQVLPACLLSALTFRQPGDSELLTVNLLGRVSTPVKLIDPDAPSNPAKVTLTRTGDEFLVTFAVFDSNLDVDTANLKVSYEFVEDGATILPEPADTDLADAIRTRQPRLVQGQSFMVRQRFSNAKQHKKVTSVRVTVSDGETTVSASGTLARTAGAQSVRDRRDAALLLPPLRLGPALNENAQGAASPLPAVKRLRFVSKARADSRTAIFKKRSETKQNAHDHR